MKKANKGFSMVELIIVIAIMAILAGALAPALIKYINKSRLSSDIESASAIATACQTAIATEAGYDAAADSTIGYSSGILMADIYTKTDACSTQIQETCGSTAPKLKAKKCLGKDASGTSCTKSGYGGDFKVTIDTQNNSIVIEESTGGHVLYPTADSCITG